jgi:hypothetical protein
MQATSSDVNVVLMQARWARVVLPGQVASGWLLVVVMAVGSSFTSSSSNYGVVVLAVG